MPKQWHEDRRLVSDERHQHEHLLQAAEGGAKCSAGKIRTINCAIKHCSRINGIGNKSNCHIARPGSEAKYSHHPQGRNRVRAAAGYAGADAPHTSEGASEMLKELTADKIYIVCGHTDMRKSIDGLASIVQQQFKLDLFTNSAFLFCGRRRNRLKVLLWEGDGFLMLYKRLEDGRFNWPKNEQEVRNLTREQFIWLMQGLSIDQPKAIKQIEGGVDIC